MKLELYTLNTKGFPQPQDFHNISGWNWLNHITTCEPWLLSEWSRMSAASEVPVHLSARILSCFFFPRYYFYKFKSSRSGIKAILVVVVKWNLTMSTLSLLTLLMLRVFFKFSVSIQQCWWILFFDQGIIRYLGEKQYKWDTTLAFKEWSRHIYSYNL